jgi:hypothetical protein
MIRPRCRDGRQLTMRNERPLRVVAPIHLTTQSSFVGSWLVAKVHGGMIIT